ncbi:amino acid permease, partial [Burkholderia territorii]
MSDTGLRPSSADASGRPAPAAAEGQTLQRSLTWKDGFWVTSGVPAGVLFTIGGVCATIGQPAWAIWIAAITMGLIQSA